MYRPADRTNPYSRASISRKASPVDRLAALDRPEDGTSMRAASCHGTPLGQGLASVTDADASEKVSAETVCPDHRHHDAGSSAHDGRRHGGIIVGAIIAALVCLLSSAGHSSILALIVVSFMSVGILLFVAMVAIGVFEDMRGGSHGQDGRKTKGRSKRG